MRKTKTLIHKIQNVSFDFSGDLDTFLKRADPLKKNLDKVLEYNDISPDSLKDFQIVQDGSELVFTLNYEVEVETPQKDKVFVSAYQFSDREEYGRVFVYKPGFGRIVMSYVSKHDFKMDYKTGQDTKELKDFEEIYDYIRNEDINWFSEYAWPIATIIRELGYECNDKLLEEFFENEYLWFFLLSESGKSINEPEAKAFIVGNWMEMVNYVAK